MRPLTAVAVTALLALALSGCSAPAGPDEAPTSTSPSTSPGPVPSGSTSATPSASPSPSTSPSQSSSPSPSPSPDPSPEPTDPDDAPAGPPDWGDPASKTLRPGINMVHDGAGCTTSFLFHVDWTTYYLATAAHCVGPGDVSEGCTRQSTLPTATAELQLTDGRTVRAPVVYQSWATMTRIGEQSEDTCQGNDFALMELPAEALPDIHPASLHFRAPTGLATAATSDIWGYGASLYKGGLSASHPKQGTHLGTNLGGWSHLVYLATPGIPGDSGGHIMTEDGKALGIASTLIATPYPGANHYTDIAKALAYMQQYEGWAPALVTWDDFHASLV